MGRWDLARHLEIIPDAAVSSVPVGLKRRLAKEQAVHLKVTAGGKQGGKGRGNPE